MRNLRYALRHLLRNPSFAILAVATLGLGIGADVAIFTAVDAVLFRPLSVRDPGSLVRLYATDVEGLEISNSSYPVYTDYRDGATSFDGVAAFDDAEPLHLSTGGKPERLVGAVVSGNFFDVLGVRAQRGRLLSSSDDRVPGNHPVAVVSDRLWRSRFAGSDAAVGASVQINNHPFTIIGVAPRGFTGVNLDSLPDLWVPAAMVDQALPELAESHVLTGRNLGWLDIVARLKPGVSIARAQAKLDTIARRRAGLGLGALGSAAASRLLRSLLFGISAFDPPTWIAVAALLSAVAVVAALIPALSAARIDPVVSLRSE